MPAVMGGARKSALAVFFFLVASAFAQDHAAVMAAESSACGPSSTTFAVSPDADQHPTPQPDSDKALVFVVEDLGQCADCYSAGSPLAVSDVSDAVTKVGADGVWVGANKGKSHFFFTTTPGEHHLCVNWQSRLSERAQAFAMASLTAEAGKVYYFRSRLFPGRADFSFDLDPVNRDEGKFLVAAAAYSVSHPKK
jgi:hypothetical protein